MEVMVRNCQGMQVLQGIRDLQGNLHPLAKGKFILLLTAVLHDLLQGGGHFLHEEGDGHTFCEYTPVHLQSDEGLNDLREECRGVCKEPSGGKGREEYNGLQIARHNSGRS